MLRPILPLRRSVDLSRRPSQGPQTTIDSSLPSVLTASGDAVSGSFASDADAGKGMSTTLPRLQRGVVNPSTLQQEQHPRLPATAQRLFTSGEIVQLRVDARLEYYRGRRLQELKDVLHEEEEQRRLVVEDAVGQAQALRAWERSDLEAVLRAKSAEALPLQLLEQRIQARITHDYAEEDAKLRQEGRAAWMEQVVREKAAATETEADEVARRATSHRFRAAVTFVIVQERTMRASLEDEAAHDWEAFVQAEEASKTEAARQAMVRFLNTPEQLAIVAARERRERRQVKAAAKQRKLFEEQQETFVKGCHHGAGGSSVFEGNAPKKICSRCRVKLDEELGYFVSLDHAVKTHPPPPSFPASAAEGVQQSEGAATHAAGDKSALSDGTVAPAMQKKKTRK